MIAGSPLPPLAPEWAPYEEPFQDIAHIVGLATGFVLIPVAVPGPDLASALAQWLGEAGHPVAVHELLGDAEWERLAAFLLSPEPPGVTMVIGLEAAAPRAAGPLGLVNQARDAIVRVRKRPLLWCGPRSFLNLTWQHAPDFWSIRSVDHSLYSYVGAVPARALPSPAVPAAAPPGPAPAQPASTVVAPRTDLGPAPPPPEETLLSKAVAQGDAFSAAILAAREAEELLSAGRPGETLRLVDQHLSLSNAVPAEHRQRLVVLRARSLRLLGRAREATAELDALLSEQRLSGAVEVEAVRERAQIALDSGDVDSAEEGFSRAQRLAGQAGDASAEILARIGLGEAALLRGRTDEARAILSRAAVDARRMNDDGAIRMARSALARAHEQAQDSSATRRLMAAEKLDHALLLRAHDAAMRAGLAHSRAALLAGIPRALIAGLQLASTPAAQTLLDLSGLNEISSLTDGTRPLEVWLRNAIQLAGPRPEAAVFREALTALGAPRPESLHSTPPPATSDESGSAAAPPTSPDATAVPTSMNAGTARALRLVVLHSWRDSSYADRLRAHLTPLLRAGLASWWSIDQVVPGEEVLSAIERQIAQAEVLLVLVSADFLADSPGDAGLMKRVEAASAAGKRVVPILVRPCLWESSLFGHRMALPTNGRPISTWRNQDEAWTDVVGGLRHLLRTGGAGLNP